MWSNCKVLRKWETCHFFINPIFSGLFLLSNKRFGTPPNDLIFWRSYPPLTREGMCSSYVSCDLLIFDPGSTCTPKKAQMEQKVIIVFIENWKERALILTDFNSRMARFFSEFFPLFEFGHLQGFSWGQSWTKNPNYCTTCIVSARVSAPPEILTSPLLQNFGELDSPPPWNVTSSKKLIF